MMTTSARVARSWPGGGRHDGVPVDGERATGQCRRLPSWITAPSAGSRWLRTGQVRCVRTAGARSSN